MVLGKRKIHTDNGEYRFLHLEHLVSNQIIQQNIPAARSFLTMLNFASLLVVLLLQDLLIPFKRNFLCPSLLHERISEAKSDCKKSYKDVSAR